MKYTEKTKYCLNIVIPFFLLFQLTLPTIEKKINLQINFGDLIVEKCNNSEHSHPPLSKKKLEDDPVKFVKTEVNNLFFVSTPYKFFINSGENNFKKFTTLPKLSLTPFQPTRGPPYFEV